MECSLYIYSESHSIAGRRTRWLSCARNTFTHIWRLLAASSYVVAGGVARIAQWERYTTDNILSLLAVWRLYFHFIPVPFLLPLLSSCRFCVLHSEIARSCGGLSVWAERSAAAVNVKCNIAFYVVFPSLYRWLRGSTSTEGMLRTSINQMQFGSRL